MLRFVLSLINLRLALNADKPRRRLWSRRKKHDEEKRGRETKKFLLRGESTWPPLGSAPLSVRTMMHLAHTAHCQFLGLMCGVLAWILLLASCGLNEWRLWFLSDVSVVTSGVAWVGIWRACFYSHALPGIETCRRIAVSDAFAPAEIAAAQVLMVLAALFGLAANVSAAAAMRLAYFSLDDRRNMPRVFVLAGALYGVTAAISAVPLALNMNSVLGNRTIDFPPEFQLPAAPERQAVGSAVAIGVFASALMAVSGAMFLCYRYAWETPKYETPRPPPGGPGAPGGGPGSPTALEEDRGRDNPTFSVEDVS